MGGVVQALVNRVELSAARGYRLFGVQSGF